MNSGRNVTAMLALMALAACPEPGPQTYQGYAEGEYVRVALPFAGRLERLHVQRGAQVMAGDPLFALERENEAAARREAEERLRNAEAQLANMQKGRRPTEIEAIRAQIEQAETGLRLSQAQLGRSEQLVAQNFISKERLDEARAAYERDRARVAQLKADLATARLAARADEIKAARAAVAAARATLEQADWKLGQKVAAAPVAGAVVDTFYVKGEWVAAGAPVVSLLPPQNIKVRFFVPEPQLGALRVGQDVGIHSAVIDVSGLSKSFDGRRAVDDVTIRVERGHICGFLGPNGSGKTTTIRMLCGLLTPDSGSGTCLGLDIIRDAAAIKHRVGYMTQRFSLYEDLSIRENLDFIARVYAVPDRRRAVEATLERVGLAPRSRQLAGQLSGGWKQRLALAACMLHEPQLLLLDEPTAGVDPKARREFWEQIHELAAGGITVLVSTHYMDEAERCHELAYIVYGRLLATGTAQEVIARSRLTTWAVTGPDLIALALELKSRPGVAMVVPFGNTLHVSGTDEAALEHTVAAYRGRPDLVWQRSKPGLEDVFIKMMEQARDNFA